MTRHVLRDNWLGSLYPDRELGRDYTLESASADASFRQYFRLRFSSGESQILMDAPPEREDCRPFLKVAALFREAGVHVPQVIAENLTDGFLLLSDLGTQTYLDVLSKNNASRLYDQANAALVAIQLASRPGVLPAYDHALLSRELALFPTWYINAHVKIQLTASEQTVLDTAFEKILAQALSEPQVFVHRDYHSRNLMFSGDAFPKNPGVIDFQDAVYGPISYDLVSLYRDAYINWEEDDELDFVIRYWEKARQASLPVAADFPTFYRSYEWMGVQRQIKVLGIFARLCHRDGKTGYVNDMPRVMAYLQRTCERYAELRPLRRLLEKIG